MILIMSGLSIALVKSFPIDQVVEEKVFVEAASYDWPNIYEQIEIKGTTIKAVLSK